MPRSGGINLISFGSITVPLGSTTELPAESCNEIKASEGGHVTSGKYWMQVQTVSSSQVVLTDCDMETGGRLIAITYTPQFLFLCLSVGLKDFSKTNFQGNQSDECKGS